MENVDQIELDNCLKLLRSMGHLTTEKKVIDVTYQRDCEDHPIASIFPDDKYIQFHEEFTQIGVKVPGLKDLMQKWDHNHT